MLITILHTAYIEIFTYTMSQNFDVCPLHLDVFNFLHISTTNKFLVDGNAACVGRGQQLRDLFFAASQLTFVGRLL